MAESISLYVSEQTSETIGDIAQERYGTTTQKSVVVAEALRTDMYYSMKHEVDAETPIVTKAKQVPAHEFKNENIKKVVGLEHITEDASDKTTIRVSLPSQLVDYLDAFESGRGRTLDSCMDMYQKLLYIELDEMERQEQDDEEDEQKFSDVNEYLLQTDKSELTVEDIDAHEVKESSKYRIPYLLGKMNDKYPTDMNLERSDVDEIVRDTFTVSEPTAQSYRSKVYESLESPLPGDEDNILCQKLFDNYNKKAPGASGMTKERTVAVYNMSAELTSDTFESVEKLINSYTSTRTSVQKNKTEVADDLLELLNTYKNDEDVQIDFIDNKLDEIIAELKEI